MGGFFPGAPPNNEPFVPSGQDTYDVPPPSFRLIGQAFGAGLKDSGFNPLNPVDYLETLVKWTTYLLAWLLQKILCIVAFVMQLITSVDDAAAPGFDAVARSSLQHVFGIDAGAPGARRIAAGVNSDALGAALGQQIIATLTSGLGGSVGQPLQPSNTAAANLVAKLARIGIEGWVDGMVGEACSLGYLKSVLELVPIMGQTLGLNRVARRALASPLKVLVEDPYLWQLNLTYRPTLLAEATAVREYLRGKLDANGLDQALGKLGYSPAAIAALVNINTKQLGLADLDYLVSHGYYSTDQATQALQADGWDQVTAGNLLNLAIRKRLDTINTKLLDASVAAFQRGDMDPGAFHDAVAAAPLSADEKAVFEAVEVQIRALNIKHLTLAEVETLVKNHIMTIDDVRTWMTRENYPPDEQTYLELYLFQQIGNADAAKIAKGNAATARQNAAAAKQAAAQQKAAQASAKAATKGVSLADFQRLVESGQRTIADYQAFLGELQLPAASIQDLVDLLQQQITTKQQTTAAHNALTAEADTKHVPLSTIEKQVESGAMSIDEFQTWLQQQEYAPADIQTLVSYVQSAIAAAKAKGTSKSTLTTTGAAKGVSLAQLERAARLGLTTVQAYETALTNAGYDPTSVDLLVGELEAQITADQAAAAKRKEAAAKAGAKGISLAQLETAVVAGLQSIDSYNAQLTALGYTSDDIATLDSLLQLKIDHSKDVAAAKATANVKLASGGLSQGQLETAVKLGVMTVDQYTAILQQAGFSQQDITILQGSILAELAKTTKAKTVEKTVAGQLASKGISLAQEQQSVASGVQTIQQYQAWLLGYGYSGADAQQLTDLMQTKLDTAKAASAAKLAAQAKAADKDISLSDLEKAVLAGIRTPADYQAQLQDLGLNAVDQATLMSLLQTKIAAAAAKAGGATTAPPASSPTPTVQ